MSDLRGVDLNLLASLHVLLKERHVTRSAERLGITQPAMSATLARARVLFGDALLVRGSKGLTLTPRAERILEQLAEVTATVEQMIALPTEFDAATSSRKFSLIGTDFIELFLLPRLMAVLAVEAPGVDLLFKGPDFKNLEPMMAAGELDLTIGYCPGVPESLTRKVAFQEDFVCISRKGHARIPAGDLSLDRYIALSHVQALPKESAMYASAIDVSLAALGLVRKVALWQPSFLAVPYTVASTDLISTIPRRLARHLVKTMPTVALDLHELPFAIPTAEIALYWHERQQNDPGHRWFRQRVAEVLSLVAAVT